MSSGRCPQNVYREKAYAAITANGKAINTVLVEITKLLTVSGQKSSGS